MTGLLPPEERCGASRTGIPHCLHYYGADPEYDRCCWCERSKADERAARWPQGQPRSWRQVALGCAFWLVLELLLAAVLICVLLYI